MVCDYAKANAAKEFVGEMINLSFCSGEVLDGGNSCNQRFCTEGIDSRLFKAIVITENWPPVKFVSKLFKQTY